MPVPGGSRCPIPTGCTRCRACRAWSSCARCWPGSARRRRATSRSAPSPITTTPCTRTAFFSRNLLYNITQGTRLTIGKFCAIATGASFMFPDANHAVAGPSTYPFGIMGGAFAEALPLTDYLWRPAGETVVGHDVWIGMDALVMPGVRIGHGAVIGARAVVTRDVPDYAVVAGNPARVVKRRYAEEDAARLVALAWWDWPVADIARAVPLLVNGTVAALEDFAARR